MSKLTGRRNKGIASVFGSVFILILVIAIASTLFLALYTYEEKAQESITVEEQRVQEKIVLLSLATENVSGTEYLKAILVNNTGTITTRIRALYIDTNFICDPTNPALNPDDTYINPKDSLWIQIPSNLEYNPLSKIELATERGIKSVEYEWKLKSGSQAEPPSETQRFNFGPLLLDFEKFYYTENYNSNPVLWKPGWSVEKGATVVWNVTVTNIDDRDLTINKYSGFTIVSNDGGVQLPWFIEPPNGLDTLFIESNSTVHLIYIWNKPRMTQGVGAQSVYNQNDRSKVFLTFFGIFHEHDGSTKPYGQTIPFEAVLVRDPQIIVSAAPTVIAVDSTMTSTITATIRDVMGILAPNVQVSFSTTLGILSSTTATTDSNGIASVTLSPGSIVGTATVTASWGGNSKSTSVTIASTALSLSASPSIVAANSPMTSTVSARVTLNGNPISGQTVTFSATPTLGTLSSTTATTNTQGYATITFTPGTNTGTTTITATLGSQIQSTSITVSSGSLSISADLTTLAASSTMTSTITARVMINGNPISNQIVSFSSTPNLGTLSALTSATNAQGYAIVTFTPGTNTGTTEITVTWGTLTQSTPINIASGAVTVTPNPSTLAVSSTMTSRITAVILLGGNPVANTLVSFTTNRGTLSSSTATTNSAGEAIVILSSDTTPGDATVSATWQGLSASTIVTMAAGDVSVESNPTIITASSTETAQITASVSLNGSPVINAQVTFNTTMGSLSATLATTDSSGVATVTLSPGSVTGIAQVTATWEDITNQTNVTIS